MSEPQVVTVRGLRKPYGTRVVVDDLDLDVPAGEIVGLIGANGAGKTTTVECIQGLRKPDSGRLSVLGFDPATQAAQLRPLVGSQLQQSALPDRLRAGEALELFSMPQARDGGELLEQFGLTARRRSVFSSLSGGERQRLFLVLALLNRPRLVILDELTQGLDPAARRNVWAAVRQLNDEGTTVLLVTHELDEAEALCGQVVVLRAGHVIDAGTPADLVERHSGAAVIRFSMPDPPARLLDEISRFAAAGFPRWSFAIAQLVVGLLTTAVGCALLLAVAAPVYGVPAVHDAWRVAVALPLGAVAFVSLGVLLGSLLPSARSDQALAGMLRAGASGFVLKGVPAEDLQRAVRAVTGGGAWLDPAVTARVLAIYRSGPAARTRTSTR